MTDEIATDKRMSRSDFLKLAGAGAIALFGGGRPNDEAEPSVEEQTRRVLAENGLPSNRVILEWAIGRHNITDYLMARILKGFDLILGEFKSMSVYARLRETVDNKPPEVSIGETLEDLRERFLQPAIGMTPQEDWKHTKNLQTIIKEEKAIATTDGLSFSWMKETKWQGDVIGAAIEGLGVLCAIPLTAYLLKELKGRKLKGRKRLSRRDFIIASFLAGGVISGEIVLATIFKPGVEGRIKVLEWPDELQQQAEKLLPRDPFVQLAEGLIKLRNLVMAANTWSELSRIGKEDICRHVLFFGGSGHGPAQDRFLSGPNTCGSELTVYAKRFCGETLDTLLTKGLPDETIASLLVGYAYFFSQPHLLGREEPTEFFSPPERIYPSARTILLNTLHQQMEKADSRRRTILENVRAALLFFEVEIDNSLAVSELLLTGKDPRMIAKEVKGSGFSNFFPVLDSGSKSDSSFALSLKKGYSRWLGSVQHGGRIYPVVETETGEKKVLMFRGQTAELKDWP